MKWILKSALSAAVLFGAAGAAQADLIVIDNFDLPSPAIQYNFPSASSPQTFVTLNVQPGVNRSVTFSGANTNPAGPASLEGIVGAGIFSVAANGFTSGSAQLNYSFTAPIDFTINGPGGILNFLSFADAPLGASTPISFEITTMTGNLTFATTLANSSGFVASPVALSSFTGPGSLASATGLNITITGAQSADFGFDAINFTTPDEPAPVPAPPAALLALLALPALGLRKRWNKKEPVLA